MIFVCFLGFIMSSCRVVSSVATVFDVPEKNENNNNDWKKVEPLTPVFFKQPWSSKTINFTIFLCKIPPPPPWCLHPVQTRFWWVSAKRLTPLLTHWSHSCHSCSNPLVWSRHETIYRYFLGFITLHHTRIFHSYFQSGLMVTWSSLTR